MNEELFNKVMCRINAERARIKAIRNFVISSTICAITMVSLVFIGNAFARELSLSGFSQYASLAFWDIKAVLINRQDYAFILLESFPVVNTAELLAVLVILMLSIKFIILYGKQSTNYAKQ